MADNLANRVRRMTKAVDLDNMHDEVPIRPRFSDKISLGSGTTNS